MARFSTVDDEEIANILENKDSKNTKKVRRLYLMYW